MRYETTCAVIIGIFIGIMGTFLYMESRILKSATRSAYQVGQAQAWEGMAKHMIDAQMEDMERLRAYRNRPLVNSVGLERLDGQKIEELIVTMCGESKGLPPCKDIFNELSQKESPSK